MIKSVQKATRLLSILADHSEHPVSLAELSRRSELNKSTCSHIISTLEAEGFVMKISHSKGYILGPAAYCLSRFGRYKNDLISVCRPIMQYLYRNSGYSVILAVIEGDTKYIVDCIDDGRIFEKKAHIREDDIYRTATGRAILANISADQIYSIYKKYGLPDTEEWPQFSDFEDFFAYISRQKQEAVIKSRGFHNQKVYLGYGTALFNKIGCVGALGIAARVPIDEESRFEEEEKKIIKLLERGTKEVNRRLAALHCHPL